MSKLVSVYARKGKLHLRSSSRTTAGLWIEDESATTLDAGSSAAERGEAILAALSRSTTGVPHPTSWRGDNDAAYWEFAGVKSWSVFVKGAACVGVKLRDGRLIFSPSANNGAKRGFTPVQGGDFFLPSDLPAREIGAALARAFALCEPSTAV